MMVDAAKLMKSGLKIKAKKSSKMSAKSLVTKSGAKAKL